MVIVELQTPVVDRETETVEWKSLVVLRVDGHQHEIEGDEGILDLALVITSLSTGEPITFDQAPDDWARSLPGAYRAPDLLATVVHDDDPSVSDVTAAHEAEATAA